MTDPSDLSPQELRQLFQGLCSLPLVQFQEICFSLNPPAGLIPEGTAQGNAVNGLLGWAQGPGGCGLQAVWSLLAGYVPTLQRYNQTHWLVPLERNRCFTGRESALFQLRTTLTWEGRAGLSQVQAIAGLGGIGKTQTALEYAYRYFWDTDIAEPYQTVFWLRVDTEAAIQTGFQAIAESLALPQAPAKEPEVVVQAVKTWLAGERNWLLVLDNADAPELVVPYLPTQGQGHVLITSRVQDLQQLGIIQPLSLDALDPEEALTFLLNRTERHGVADEEKTAAAELANELGYLPLALEQAGAYLVAKRASFANYLTSYRRRQLALLNQSAPIFGGYRDPIATTWDINFQTVEDTAPAAADLLRVSAFLHPDSIPHDLIVKGAEHLGDLLQTALADAHEDPLVFGELLEPLSRYSLIQPGPDPTYAVHRLVQAVVKSALTPEAERLWAERVVRMVTDAYPNADDFKNWPECERLLLQAQAAAAAVHAYGFDFVEAGLLLNRLGFYFSERGQYVETEPCYVKGLEIYKHALGEEHADVADSLNNLALLYRAQGRYDQAEPLYQQALEMRKRLLGDDHPAVANSLNNLAALYDSQGRYEQAEPLYQQALELWKRLLGDDHPDVANSLNNLAELYRAQGRYEQAEPLYQQALEMRKRLLGDDHPAVANSLNNLAALYDSQGRYEQAEPLYQQALEMLKRLLGDDHPAVATSLNNLALLYDSQGRYEQAEPLYQQALELRKRLLGDDHPDVASSLFNLGGMRYQQGEFEAAKALLLQARPIYEATLGLDHPNTQALQSWIDAVENKLTP